MAASFDSSARIVFNANRAHGKFCWAGTRVSGRVYFRVHERNVRAAESSSCGVGRSGACGRATETPVALTESSPPRQKGAGAAARCYDAHRKIEGFAVNFLCLYTAERFLEDCTAVRKRKEKPSPA